MQARPSPPSRASRSGWFSRPRGFALIISLTLSAFLLVLLFSLSFMLRVNADLAGGVAPEIQARQNALVGVAIAVGQLEKFAGHDQRITAPAEFADSTKLANGANLTLPGGGNNFFAQAVTNSSLLVTSSNPLVGLPAATLSAGLRFVTGVWGNTDPANESYQKTPSVRLLNWLMSGNEGVAYTASTFSGGQITSSSVSTNSNTIPFRPDSSVDGLTATSSALTTLTVSGNTPAVLLVGPGTVSWSPVSTLPTLTDAYVVAPLVPLSISSTLVPGLSGGSGKKISGRYAYVVLDEGVKAKVNLQDPYDGFNTMSDTSSAGVGARTRIKVAPRNAIELMPGFNEARFSTSGSISYPVNSSSASAPTTSSSFNLANVVSLKELRFVDPTATSSVADGAVKRVFHHATASSFGLLTDTLRGGFKLDLTALLDDGPTSVTFVSSATYSPNAFFTNRLQNISILPSSRMRNNLSKGDERYTWIDPAGRDPNLPGEAGEVSPYNQVLGAQPIAMPTWDILKSWYDVSKQLRPISSASVSARIGTASTSSQSAPPGLIISHIAPVLTQARMYAQVFLGKPLIADQTPPRPATATQSTWTMTYAYRIQVAFAVGNPYSASLSLPNGLEFIWMDPDYGTYTNPSGSSTWANSPATNVTLSGLNGSSNISLVLKGGFYQKSSVSNSWTVNAPYINGYNPMPTLLPPNNSGISGFLFKTAPIVIPAGGIVGFAPDPTKPDPTIPQSSSGSFAIQMLSMSANIAGTLTGSAATLTQSFYSVQSNTGTGVGTTLSISVLKSAGSSISYGTGISDGASMSIYMRDGGTHKVYSSYLNADWANPSGTTVPGLSGSLSATTGSDPNKGFSGGYLINMMYPLNRVTFSGSPTINSSILAGSTTTLSPDDSLGSYRTFADFNLQAQYHPVPWVSSPWQGLAHVPPYRGQFLDGSGTTSATAVGNGLDLMNGSWPPAWGPNSLYTFTGDPTSSLSSASSLSAYLTSTSYNLVLFDLPRRSTSIDMPILSVGFLQHANLTADDQYPFVGHQPGNAVGNSLFHPLVTRTMVKQIRPNVYYANNASLTESTSSVQGRGTNYFDMSYLLNTALWDHFYFSGIPQLTQTQGGTVRSANPRLQFQAGIIPTDTQLALGDTAATASASDALNPALKIPKEYVAARYLMTDGAFNINSTSIEAWTAVLAGLRKRDPSFFDTATTVSGNISGANVGTSFPRTLYQTKGTTGTNENTNTLSSYAGYRRLTDAQIVALATCLVQEIRLRGPFPSLASFINRGGITGSTSATHQIVVPGPEGNTSDTAVKGYFATEANTVQVAGALQMAIDRAGINIMSTTSASHTGSLSIALTARPNYAMNATGGAGAGGVANTTPYADVLPKATILGPVTTAIPAGTGVTLSHDTGIPGWLTQADILQAIGPNLSARSDTFVIRAYGDSLDLVNSPDSNIKPTDVKGRAWCEAVVQRFPDYIDPTDAASTFPAYANNQLTAAGVPVLTKLINQVYGRRFRIVSFRWLTKEEI
jgi:hypothetical protein